MQTLHIFDRKDYAYNLPRLFREAVRAIIIKNKKIALVKSGLYGYFKFPGGGIEYGETHLDTLIRETREETGLVVIPESVKAFGMIKEICKGKYGKEIFEQNSYYYTAQTKDVIVDVKLDDYEAEEGFHLEIVDFGTAITTNERIFNIFEIDLIERETYVLQLFKNMRASSNFLV